METEVVQSSSIPEIEKDTMYLQENASKKLNEGLEPDETGNADEFVQKKVQKFYFAKLWPYQDQNFKSRIAEAEKLIEKMDQDMFPVHQKHMDLLSYQGRMHVQLKHLRNHKTRIEIAMGRKIGKLDDLNVALDKLTFANNANQRTAINSCSSRELINFMVHRPNNLLTKKKLFREIKESQEEGAVNSYSSGEDWTELIQWFYGRTECQNNIKLKKKIINEIKQLERVEKEATGNATEKGKIENPLNSRKAIKDRVNLLNEISEELRKEHLEVSAKISCVRKNIDVTNEEINPLWRQWNDIWLKKEEVKRYIRNLMKQQEEARATHDRYVSVMSNARELARKEDVKALQELSLREVDTFMCDWNRSKAFRYNYEKSILQSLDHRRLSRDGWIRNLHEEPLIQEGPISIEPTIN
ncbi:hypothetical protein ACOSQ3_002376 [Xanthoceras sorbifolium]